MNVSKRKRDRGGRRQERDLLAKLRGDILKLLIKLCVDKMGI